MQANRAPQRCFARDYDIGRTAVVRELERRVLGSDYGATSWTTRDEALSISGLLQLKPAMRLLDIGARSRVVAADGAALPFADRSFDAISHSHVLCCMPAKLALLRECRRVARAGARMVFSVIAPAPGLSDAERVIAVDSGPEFVDLDGDYATLLMCADWRVLARIDVTDVFAELIRTALQVMHANTAALLEVLSAEDYRDRVARRQATLVGLERGVLRRELYAVITGSLSGGEH